MRFVLNLVPCLLATPPFMHDNNFLLIVLTGLSWGEEQRSTADFPSFLNLWDASSCATKIAVTITKYPGLGAYSATHDPAMACQEVRRRSATNSRHLNWNALTAEGEASGSFQPNIMLAICEIGWSFWILCHTHKDLNPKVFYCSTDGLVDF